VAPLAAPRHASRAPITASLRPRISMCQRHTFNSASLRAGAGIPAGASLSHEENH
jgi:hypothetical protein